MSANTERTATDGIDTRIISAQVRKTLISDVDAFVEESDELNNRSDAIRRGLELVLERGEQR